MTPNLIAWLSAPESIEERRARITGYLVNEGYELPPSPPNADYDEAGVIHRVRGQEMTVAYSVVDQGGRQVYYYVEWEIDHIMIGRIHSGDEWALEYLIPGHYDVPDLGLTDTTLPEIITAIYKQRVAGREPDFAYPVVGERAPALQVAEGESEECTSEVDD